MNTTTLYTVQFETEEEGLNLNNYLEVSVHPISVALLKNRYMRWLPFGNEYRLVGDLDKRHLLRNYDFPVDLFIELKVKDERVLRTHELNNGFSKAGYYVDITGANIKERLDLQGASYERMVHPLQALNSILDQGVYKIFNQAHDEIAEIEHPYSGKFYDILDEKYGKYYLSSDEKDEILVFFYLPRLTPSAIGLFKIRVNEYEVEKSSKMVFNFYSRDIEIRYLFSFNNEPGAFSLQVSNKAGNLGFIEMGKEILPNGKHAHRYHIETPISYAEMKKQLPLIATFDTESAQSPIQGYKLPERLYLPSISDRSIKAENEKYYCEIFINI